MKAFAQLYTTLDETTKTNEKVDALAAYFRSVGPEDAVWAIHFLIGRRIKRLIETRKLVEWAIAEAGVPEWIFGDCYSAVGDLAETIALAKAAETLGYHRYWLAEHHNTGSFAGSAPEVLIARVAAETKTIRVPTCGEYIGSARPYGHTH